MNELHVLYTFLALMTFNLLASFVYILGFNNMKTAVKKATRKALDESVTFRGPRL